MSKRIFEDWLEKYVEYTCETSEPPESFHRWCGISLIAAALQRKCVLNWGNLKFFPNMYIVIVSPSGRARKGTAIQYYLDLAEELQISVAAEATTREALIQSLNATRKSDPDPMTGELNTHSSLTIISPELTVFLGYDNQQLMSDLTDWYDCRSRWTYRTKTSTSDEIYGVWVNLLGATTPELIRTTLPLDAVGGGLTSRIIFVFEENKGRMCPAPFISPEQDRIWKNLLHDLEQIHTIRGPFQVHPDFIPLWTDWYVNEAQESPFEDPRFGGYSERRPNHVMKLCIIHSAARSDSRVITPDDFHKSLALLLSTERKMPRVFTGMGYLDYAATLSDVMIEIAKRGRTTKRDLLAKFYRDVDEWRMDKILGSLESAGNIATSFDGQTKVIVSKMDAETCGKLFTKEEQNSG